MNVPVLLVIAGMLQYPSLGGTTQIRNTFVVATETVIDNANAVDLRASDDAYEAQIKQLRLSKATLSRMAEGEREHEIADDAEHLIFLISACRIQEKSGSNADKCSAQLRAAEDRLMVAIGRHKTDGAWVEGLPR